MQSENYKENKDYKEDKEDKEDESKDDKYYTWLQLSCDFKKVNKDFSIAYTNHIKNKQECIKVHDKYRQLADDFKNSLEKWTCIEDNFNTKEISFHNYTYACDYKERCLAYNEHQINENLLHTSVVECSKFEKVLEDSFVHLNYVDNKRKSAYLSYKKAVDAWHAA